MAEDFETIVRKIVTGTGMDRDELMKLIMKKHDELGVVTLEGAALLVGKELGVQM